MGELVVDPSGREARAISRLFERVADAAGAPEEPDLAAVAAALAELASDPLSLAPWVAALGPTSGLVRLHAPARGPRLTLVHRLEGQLSAVHDHGTWVALAPVSGVETHRRYARGAAPQDMPRVAEVEELGPAAVVTMVAPDDVHDHGHLVGTGAPAYVLVLTGDDQLRYRRHEWDPATGSHRVLEPGDLGRWVADEPWPLP